MDRCLFIFWSHWFVLFSVVDLAHVVPGVVSAAMTIPAPSPSVPSQQGSACFTTSVHAVGVGAIQESTTNKLAIRRRYDIEDLGWAGRFHGWADVQGIGAPTDYCRLVGVKETLRLACALGGTHGQRDIAYESAWNFTYGHKDTWYMRDEDGDGRDDYCRCLGEDFSKSQVICTKAGDKGFFGSNLQGGKSNTFTATGPINCKTRVVFPEFGRVWGFIGY